MLLLLLVGAGTATPVTDTRGNAFASDGLLQGVAGSDAILMNTGANDGLLGDAGGGDE